MEFRGKRVKVINRMFMDAEYSFTMLKFYYDEITNLLHRRAADFHKHTDEIAEEHKQRQQPFDKQYWLKHYDVYSEYYPHIFNNSFIISACALFEHQIKDIYALIKKEHKLSRDWDDKKRGSVPSKAKMCLWHAGIVLRDAPPTIILPPPNFIPTEVNDENRFIAENLWREIENYFKVRNCIAHHNGLIQKLQYPAKVIKYASEKGILDNNKDEQRLQLTSQFNREVCDTMSKFFEKLLSVYYSTPLPERIR